MTRNEFQTALACMKSGAAFVYWRGSLHEQRQKGTQLDALAEAVWLEHLAGRCVMVQRRVDPVTYDYVAIKCQEPYRPLTYEGCYNKEWLAGAVYAYPGRRVSLEHERPVLTYNEREARKNRASNGVRRLPDETTEQFVRRAKYYKAKHETKKATVAE